MPVFKIKKREIHARTARTWMLIVLNVLRRISQEFNQPVLNVLLDFKSKMVDALMINISSVPVMINVVLGSSVT